MNSDCLDDSTFYEVKYVKSPNSTIRKGNTDDIAIELRDK